MSLRPEAKALVVALAFLAVAALPLAAADHAYSHRYIVFGRVVDAENNPVPGLTLDLGYERPFEPEGACANQPNTNTDAFGPTRTNPVTNDFGEFIFCFHTHSMSRTTPGAGILRIDALDIDKRFEFDGYTRYAFVPFVLDAPHPAANKTAASEFYTVQGRAWRAAGGPVQVEGVRVYGDTIQNQPVNVTFSYNGKPEQTINTATNGYGDFAVRVPVTERPTSGTVSIRIENETYVSSVGPLGATEFRAELPEPKDPFVTKFLIGLGIFAAVVVGGGALWFTSNRVKSARDDRLMRESSTRKRSNK